MRKLAQNIYFQPYFCRIHF